MATELVRRRLPVGAEVQPGGGAHFRCWAPRRHRVQVRIERHAPVRSMTSVQLHPEQHGFFGEGEHADRLLLVNLGRDLALDVVPEPLLAPRAGTRWGLLWSSEAPAYGGRGAPTVETATGWRLPGHAAIVLFEKPDDEDEPGSGARGGAGP